MNMHSQKDASTEFADEQPLSRREREKRAHRQAMLEAAEHVFAEKGFERATMEEVAARAEFSVGALYNFFASKEALFGEVIRGIAATFFARFRQCVEQARTPLDAIRHAIRLHFESIQQHGDFFRSVIAMRPGSAICPSAAIPEECRALYDEYVQELAKEFAQAMKRGQIREANPIYTALALEGAVHAYSAYWHRKGLELTLEDRVRIVQENFLAMLVTPKGRGAS